jgi:hypothetical protein
VDQKIVVNSNAGDVQISGKKIILEDKSSDTFVAENLTSFIGYSMKVSVLSKLKFVIYYTVSKVVMFFDEAASVFKRPVAEVSVSYSTTMLLLKRDVNGKLTQDSMELLLRKLRKHLDSKGLEMWSAAKDLKVSKVTNFERSKDNRGKLTCSYKIEGAKGGGVIDLPELITIKIPVINGLTDEFNIRSFTFEPCFDYTERDGNFNGFFSLENLQFDDELEVATSEILFEALSKIGIDMNYGKLNSVSATNKDMYMSVPVEFKQ